MSGQSGGNPLSSALSLAEESPSTVRTFTASDGYRFYYRYYPAVGRPRARLLWLHGIRSHSGWYIRSSQRWADIGYETCFLDRRGAGLNTAWRGDAPSFRRLLDDVIEFALSWRYSRSWLPLIIGGISWGGKLALALPYRKPGIADALILLCPGLKPQVQTSVKYRARVMAAAGLQPQKLFPIPLNEPELFTANPTAQQFIASDRYGLHWATARFLFQSFALDVYLQRARQYARLPLYLTLAGQDRIVDNAATLQFLSVLTPWLAVREYPEAHHTLEFEPADHPWFDHLANWLEAVVNTGTAVNVTTDIAAVTTTQLPPGQTPETALG